MSDKKELVKLAEKELEEEKKEKEVKLIKEAIKQTLEKIAGLEKEIKEKQEEKKILKQDIDNIRAGRLDLIEERQKKDEKAKKTSTIIVEKVKEVHHHYDRWYEPYRITPIYEPCCPIQNWETPGWPSTMMDTDSDLYMYTNCSVAKDASSGTYVLGDGTVKSFI